VKAAWRHLAAVAVVLSLAGCGSDRDGGRASVSTGGDGTIRVVPVGAEGVVYRCLVYRERLAGGAAGAGGLWCERTERNAAVP